MLQISNHVRKIQNSFYIKPLDNIKLNISNECQNTGTKLQLKETNENQTNTHTKPTEK